MENATLAKVFLTRTASAVSRYHTSRMQRTQSVGEHSFNILLLLEALEVPRYLPHEEAMLLYRAAIRHDLVEVATGDIPSPVKWDNPELREVLKLVEARYPVLSGLTLPTSLKNILKWADLVEMLLWCVEDRLMGNLFAGAVVARVMEAVDGLSMDTVPNGVFYNASLIYKELIDYVHKMGLTTAPIIGQP